MSEKFYQLVFNAALCLSCEELISSDNRHHFNTCSCGNVSVDGGLEYEKRSFRIKELYENKSLYECDDFEEIRKFTKRGVARVNKETGFFETVYLPISTLSNQHLVNILKGVGPEWHLKLIAKEIQYRYEHNIIIEDEYKQPE